MMMVSVALKRDAGKWRQSLDEHQVYTKNYVPKSLF